MNLSRPVIAFALLHEYSETLKTDLVGGISLLIRPVIGDLAGCPFDANVLAARLAENYGISVPPTALDGFIPRLIKSEILQEEHSNVGIPRVIYKTQESTSMADALLEQDFQSILDDYLEHSKLQLEASGIKIDDEKLVTGFLQHLCTQDFSSIKARPTVSEEASGSKIIGQNTREKIALSEELAESAAIDGLVAGYITHLNVHNKERLTLLSRVIDGAIGAELVLDLQAPSSVSKFQNTTAIIDTPILLSYLDLSSHQDEIAAKELIDNLKESGVKIAAFKHSIIEAEGVLSAIQAARSEGTAYGPTVNRLSNSVYRAFFDSMLGRISNKWQSDNSFEIIPETAGQFYVNFSAQNEEELTAKIRVNFEDRILTSERDAKSVAETIRRLGGAHIPIDKISSCRYLFVTRNASVQRRAASFLREKGIVNRDEFVPVVTDKYISGLCWIISGGRSENSPSTARLLANCAAALRLRPALADRTKKFLTQLDAEKAQHFEALMTNERASNYLMEVTFGNPAVITANNTEEIFEEIQRRAAEKITVEKDEFYGAEISKLRALHLEASSTAIALGSRITQAELDAQAKAVVFDNLLSKTNQLQAEAKAKDESILEQNRQISSLSTQVTDLSAAINLAQSEISRQRKQVINSAQMRAKRFVLLMRVIGTLLVFAIALFIGYTDKFWIPSIATEKQPLANVFLIGVQALLAILGLSLLSDRILKNPLHRVAEKIYQSRLSELGLDPDDVRKTAPLYLSQ